MNAKHSLLLLGAALVLIPFFPAAATPTVTFESPQTFDYPRANGVTDANGVNDHGLIAGQYFSTTGEQGFVRIRNHFTRPIVDPNDRFHNTDVTGINNAGTVCGFYLGTDRHYHSFVLSGSTLSEIDIGLPDVIVGGINDAGNLSGSTLGPYAAFVVIDGTVSSFTLPGSLYIEGHGMNSSNQCTGFSFDGTTTSGFRRNADGTIEFPIAAPGFQSTRLYGINDAGSMVGSAEDNLGEHGIFLGPGGDAAAYDYPGATFTRFTGIHNRGVICGIYEDASGTHAFTVRVTGE